MRVLNTYEIVTRDVPALVAFARAVLDAADEARVDGAPRVLARVFVWGTLDRIADEHLGGES